MNFSKAAVNEAREVGPQCSGVCRRSDPPTTEKGYLNEPVVVKPIR